MLQNIMFIMPLYISSPHQVSWLELFFWTSFGIKPAVNDFGHLEVANHTYIYIYIYTILSCSGKLTLLQKWVVAVSNIGQHMINSWWSAIQLFLLMWKLSPSTTFFDFSSFATDFLQTCTTSPHCVVFTARPLQNVKHLKVPYCGKWDFHSFWL